MTYDIHCYNSQADFDSVKFILMAYDLPSKREAMKLGHDYLADFPIVKVQSKDREFIVIFRTKD